MSVAFWDDPETRRHHAEMVLRDIRIKADAVSKGWRREYREVYRNGRIKEVWRYAPEYPTDTYTLRHP